MMTLLSWRQVPPNLNIKAEATKCRLQCLWETVCRLSSTSTHACMNPHAGTRYGSLSGNRNNVCPRMDLHLSVTGCIWPPTATWGPPHTLATNLLISFYKVRCLDIYLILRVEQGVVDRISMFRLKLSLSSISAQDIFADEFFKSIVVLVSVYDYIDALCFLRYQLVMRASVLVFIPAGFRRLAPFSDRLDWNEGHSVLNGIKTNTEAPSKADNEETKK